MSFLSYTHNFNNNLFMLFLRNPERYVPIVDFFGNMTENLSELKWSEAELIAAEASNVNDSSFCTGIRKGMTDALQAKPEALVNDKLAAALDFALKVNAHDGSITKEDVDAVLEAGWSEQTVEDLVGLVAVQKLYNILANGLGFKELPPAVFAEIGRGTVDNGGYGVAFRGMIAKAA
jgi:alkylhydroperoxidase family enzyme